MDYFRREMQQLLGDEYPAFEQASQLPLFRALRLNTARTDEEELRSCGFALESRTPFDEDTFYLKSEDKLGNHPFHFAGLYYLQEPSPTMVVNALDVKPGQLVADLCAAPGGKSTQILNRLQGEGLLWSNEYEASRARILLSNIERWGDGNYIITNSDTAFLADRLEGLFDRILVDAPCSGASMFRKFPQSVKDYTPGNVEACSRRQLMILDNAWRMLKKDGLLVYSTCTYNLQENEDTVAAFLNRHPDMELIDTGLSCGRRGFSVPGVDGQLVTRVFPMDGGEGHFVARMIRRSETSASRLTYLPYSANRTVDEFMKDNLTEKLPYTVIRDEVFVSEKPLIRYDGRIIRQGVLLGTLEKGRLVPHHHFFVSNFGRYFRQVCNIEDEELISRYLHGESLRIPGHKGFTAIAYKNHLLGFGKGDGVQIKNHFPKGLRLM
ncbi:MAG: RNA methyltransferase [Erysipelotrichaceae bacterium]|nr:RNA methyltransferase [Erysipelotrichaceae bacterium]